jgi:hypothetical protein
MSSHGRSGSQQGRSQAGGSRAGSSRGGPSPPHSQGSQDKGSTGYPTPLGYDPGRDPASSAKEGMNRNIDLPPEAYAKVTKPDSSPKLIFLLTICRECSILSRDDRPSTRRAKTLRSS